MDLEETIHQEARSEDSINSFSKAPYVTGSSKTSDLDPSFFKKYMTQINHYSNRILIDSWVPLVGGIALTPLALIGVVAVKLTEPDKPVFYYKRLHTSDGSEQYQIKIRTMTIDADSQRDLLIAEGKLSPAGLKSKNDPRITSIGKVLRTISLDEVWQLWQLAKHVYSIEGFIYDGNRHFHYTVSPRPQAEKNIKEAPIEFREALAKGRTGITGPYQVGEGNEGECALEFHKNFETEWIIPRAFYWLFKTPIAILRGRNG